MIGGAVMPEYATVDEYINDQPDGTREALFTLRECVLAVAPDAQELFNYNIPAFALIKNGKREHQIMIAGYSKHVGLYPHPTTIERFADSLSGFKKGKGSIQFPIDKPIPVELVIEMVRYRRTLILEAVGL